MSASIVVAVLWPVLHLALIVVLVVGAPLGIGRPRVARGHLLAAAATGAVFLAGADCPLTLWEKSARASAGWPVYEGGFIEHYLVDPVHPSGITPMVTVLIVAAWVVPSVVGHTLRWRNRHGQSNEMSSKVVAASTPMEGPAASAH